jgi:hypothetical protein
MGVFYQIPGAFSPKENRRARGLQSPPAGVRIKRPPGRSFGRPGGSVVETGSSSNAFWRAPLARTKRLAQMIPLRRRSDKPRTLFRPGAIRGHAFLGAVTSLLTVAVFVPPTAHYLETQRRLERPALRRSSAALRFAEAGLRRGLKKLGESEILWQKARVGTEIPNYNDDMTFTDERGGTYRVRFVPGPSATDVTIVATGYDEETGETRSVRAAYTRDGIRTALATEGTLALGPSVHVHWGPIVSRGDLLLGNTDGFPRKFVAKNILRWDEKEIPTTDRYANDRTLGRAPVLDMEYYRHRAKLSRVPMSPDEGGRLEWSGEGPWPALSDPPESGYFRASKNSLHGIRFRASPDGRAYSLSDPTAVIFVENDTPNPVDTWLWPNGANLELEALILVGEGNNLNLTTQRGSFRAVLPAKAADEYGPGARRPWQTFAPLLTEPGRCCQRIADAGIRGLVWVDGDIVKKDAGPISILGTVRVGGTLQARDLTIYYDDAVALSGKTDGKSLYRADWKETTDLK